MESGCRLLPPLILLLLVDSGAFTVRSCTSQCIPGTIHILDTLMLP